MSLSSKPLLRPCPIPCVHIRKTESPLPHSPGHRVPDPTLSSFSLPKPRSSSSWQQKGPTHPRARPGGRWPRLSTGVLNPPPLGPTVLPRPLLPPDALRVLATEWPSRCGLRLCVSEGLLAPGALVRAPGLTWPWPCAAMCVSAPQRKPRVGFCPNLRVCPAGSPGDWNPAEGVGVGTLSKSPARAAPEGQERPLGSRR